MTGSSTKHDEADDGHEVYVSSIVAAPEFELDGETLDAPVGTLVFAAPGVKRTAFAEEPGTTLVAVGGVPGKAYQPQGWEIWAPLVLLYEAGGHEQLADRLDQVLANDPPYWVIHYNSACIYSLAGRPRKALEHLRRAIELGGDARLGGDRHRPRRDSRGSAFKGAPRLEA